MAAAGEVGTAAGKMTTRPAEAEAVVEATGGVGDTEEAVAEVTGVEAVAAGSAAAGGAVTAWGAWAPTCATSIGIWTRCRSSKRCDDGSKGRLAETSYVCDGYGLN